MTFRLEATTRLSLWQICNRSEIRPQSQRTEGQTLFVMLGNAPKMSIALQGVASVEKKQMSPKRLFSRQNWQFFAAINLRDRHCSVQFPQLVVRLQVDPKMRRDSKIPR